MPEDGKLKKNQLVFLNARSNARFPRISSVILNDVIRTVKGVIKKQQKYKDNFSNIQGKLRLLVS